MAPFPDNLPPEGLDTVMKLLIYFGILYILTTAITTWLITRRRSFTSSAGREQTGDEGRQTVVQTSVGITKTLSFDDTKDKLSSLKVEIQGAEAALTRLQELKNSGQISGNAFQKLKAKYDVHVSDLTAEMNDMLQSNIESTSGEVNEGISDAEMEEIEADLEKQLMDLDKDDDFLKSRPKRKIDDIFEEEASETQPEPRPPATSTPSTPAQPSSVPVDSTPSSTPPTPKAQQPKRVPMPPSSGKTEQSSQSAPSTPAASAPSAPSTASKTSPAPPKPSEKKSVSMPPPPKKGSSPKAVAPPPPKKVSPQAQESRPKASQPLSAAQPMKVQSEDEEGMFAKSTSIAALRMDMLRELARLKKLIPEDQEKDQ